MNSEPLVSVIIPTYNRADLIGETLNSVLGQTYENWECIIVDDGSIDNTNEVVNEFVKKDQRFQFHSRPSDRPKGANACRNYGFEISKGEYINWFDSDDILHKDFVLYKIRNFENENLDCVLSKTCFFNNDIAQITKYEQRTNLNNNILEDFIVLKTSWYVADPLWKKKYLEGKILFNEKLLKGQDRDFHIRMLINKPRIKIINDYLYFYRDNGKSISTNFSKEVAKSMFEIGKERNKQLLEHGISDKVKFVILKQQVYLFPYLKNEKKILSDYLKIFKDLFTLNFRTLFYFFKFLLSVFTFKLFNKGSILLK